MKQKWIERWNRETLPYDLTRKQRPQRGREGGGERIWRAWTWRISNQNREKHDEDEEEDLPLKDWDSLSFFCVPLITNIFFFIFFTFNPTNLAIFFFLRYSKGKIIFDSKLFIFLFIKVVVFVFVYCLFFLN